MRLNVYDSFVFIEVIQIVYITASNDTIIFKI
jgi:hypothetical protein